MSEPKPGDPKIDEEMVELLKELEERTTPKMMRNYDLNVIDQMFSTIHGVQARIHEYTKIRGSQSNKQNGKKAA